MRILAHRGASADFPENTLEAFEGAVLQKADGVELDVQRCSSGELVVCHDEQLDRLAGLSWWITATPYWKLKKADVGCTLGFDTARIPLLEEVFELLPEEMLVNVELKCDTVDDRGLTYETAQLVTELGLTDRVIVSSFNPFCLARLADGFPELKRGQLIDPDRSWLLQSLWTPFTARESIHPHFRDVTQSRVRAWKAKRYAIAVWTVDDEAEASRLEGLGVDYLITNRPARFTDRPRSSR